MTLIVSFRYQKLSQSALCAKRIMQDTHTVLGTHFERTQPGRQCKLWLNADNVFRPAGQRLGCRNTNIRAGIKDNVAVSDVILEQLPVNIRLWVTKTMQQAKRVTSLVRKPKIER